MILRKYNIMLTPLYEHKNFVQTLLMHLMLTHRFVLFRGPFKLSEKFFDLIWPSGFKLFKLTNSNQSTRSG
jgi:hypothetical protein